MIINSFNELSRIIKLEKSLYDKRQGLKRYIPSSFQMYKTLSYLKTLRRVEYLEYKINNTTNPILKNIFICSHYYFKQKWMRLGLKNNLDIGLNSVEEGIVIFHNANGIVINENSHIGKNCEFHGNNCVGNDGIEIYKAPKIGNNVHFGVGACVLGDVTIADGIWIAAGAVVVSSFLEPNIVIGGIPAKKIKNKQIMNNPLVSILVPIYGVEKYIKRCAISLFEQTYKNIEFVFVNDCTRDSSISVLKGVVTEYPHLADKVKIINHIRNKGLAAARNTAVKESSGDFIFHVDADDWLEKTAIESCVNVQEVNDADVVTVNAKAIWNNRVELYNTPSTTNPKDLLRAILSRRAICNIWGRLIRKSLYVNNNIFNVEGLNISEDLQIMPQLLFFSSKIAVCTKPLYNYECRNQSSYTSTYNIKSDLQNQETAVILRDFMQKNDSALLKYIDVLDITNVVLSIKGCMKDDRNLDFFRSNVLGRRENLNSSLFKDIPLADRLTLYIKNEWLLKEYVRLASFIKIKILKR